jgi:uncharacterized damage-inducible protein DinB
MFHDICRMFARYNGWANDRVYAAAAELSPHKFTEDRGAFFGSMMGTLNHLLVTDRIWLRRFTGEGPSPTALNVILHKDLPTLRAERTKEDARIIAYIEGLSDAALAKTFSYQPITTPRIITQKLGPTLSHLFNHQTHHRGQAHAILTGFHRDAPSLDLVLFQRETGVGLE